MLSRVFSTKVSKTAFWLIIYCIIVYASMLVNKYDLTFESILKVPLYLIMFVVGKGYICDFKDDNDKLTDTCFYIFFVIGSGYFIRHVADVLSPVNNTVLINAYARIIPRDVFSGGPMPTTIMAGWGIPLACLFYPCLVGYCKNKLIKWIVIIENVILVICSFTIGSRTYIGVLLAEFVLTFLVDLFFISNREGKQKIKLLGIVIIALIAIALVIRFNAFGVRDAFLQSSMFDRIQNGSLRTGFFSSNGRDNIFDYFFQNIQNELFGGGKLQTSGHEQHVWYLQVFDLYGVIAFAILVIVVFKIIYEMVLYLRLKGEDSFSKVLILSIVSSLLVYSFIEPVVTSNNIIIALLFTSVAIYEVKITNINIY